MRIKKFIEVIISLSFLMIGGGIYILFRSKTLLMFRWFEALGLMNFIDAMRDTTKDLALCDFITYSLPDGLWVSSYLLMVDVVVERDSKTLLLWSSLLPGIAILFEILQFFYVIPGVFDIFDLFCYMIPFIVYLIYLKHEKAL